MDVAVAGGVAVAALMQQALSRKRKVQAVESEPGGESEVEERAADFSSTDDDDNVGSSDDDSDDDLPLGALADRNPL